MATETLTPMMRQYRRIKSELPAGALLLFRMGDFYEMFFEDAREAAPILGVTLTQRNGIPMCGVPYHALEPYLARLIRARRRAAICEQMEDPATARGIVRREVTRVVTPGTVTEELLLDSARNHYLAGVHHGGGDIFGVGLLDLSTGTFEVERVECADRVADFLARYTPGEVIVAADQRQTEAMRLVLKEIDHAMVTEIDAFAFDLFNARERILRHFDVQTLDGYGCENQPVLIAVAGAMLHYIRETLHQTADHIRGFSVRLDGDSLVLDAQTCRNLALIASDGTAPETTLLGVLDHTHTAMGARCLRQWILRPSRVLAIVRQRHDAVARLTRQRELLDTLSLALKEVRDLERLIARVDVGRCNARDLRAVYRSLLVMPRLRTAILDEGNDDQLERLARELSPLPAIASLLETALEDSPPLAIKEGGMIRAGFHAELDGLRQRAGEARSWLARYQTEEQSRTRIKNLKIRHNKVFGYFIEIPRSQSESVPENYVRKQTLVNAERFSTPDLIDYEQRILGSHDRAVALEYELFQEIRGKVAEHTHEIQTSAAAIGQIDTLVSFADRALALGYVRPEMDESLDLEIREGRHPVIEQLPDAERFVPNDTKMDGAAHRMIVITGPNMAGKSTYIRQVALLAIMAHTGSFVPASFARFGILDRVFTRVGAGDDLARGRSTFMVEMQETANILHNATAHSLVVLDEIGRGTSTFDGISIAWAVAEFLHGAPHLRAKTLFATHYHELTELAITLDGIQNFTVKVHEQGERIVFLRRIVPGTADKSYGIHVARLAGLPVDVLARAREILANLEDGALDSGVPRLARRRVRKERNLPGQMMLFND